MDNLGEIINNTNTSSHVHIGETTLNIKKATIYPVFKQVFEASPFCGWRTTQ